MTDVIGENARMSVADDLIGKAERREALFGIIGLGYVGLPLAVELAHAGYRVIGFDVSRRVVEGLMARRSHVKGVSGARRASIRKGAPLIPTNRKSVVE